MFQALHSLVTDTHHTNPRYKPGAEVYPWVDLQPNLKLKSIYSGEEFDPEEVITEAFQIEHELAERTKLLQTTESRLSGRSA